MNTTSSSTENNTTNTAMTDAVTGTGTVAYVSIYTKIARGILWCILLIACIYIIYWIAVHLFGYSFELSFSFPFFSSSSLHEDEYISPINSISTNTLTTTTSTATAMTTDIEMDSSASMKTDIKKMGGKSVNYALQKSLFDMLENFNH